MTEERKKREVKIEEVRKRMEMARKEREELKNEDHSSSRIARKIERIREDLKSLEALRGALEVTGLVVNADEIMETYEDLIGNVNEWSKKWELDEGNPEKQFMKFMEEVGEFCSAYLKKNVSEMIDALGDIQVTLIVLHQQLKQDPKDTLQIAYHVIEQRTGKMVDGVFVKKEDLK